MNRRQFLATSTLAATTLLPGRTSSQSRPATPSQPAIPDNLSWHNVRDWGVEGRAFTDTADYYDRLPARAQGNVPAAVWGLSKCAAGMRTRFQTDAPEIRVRYRLNSDNLAMSHMPATGVSGVDLYARHNGAWRWLSTAFPKSRNVHDTLTYGLAPGTRDYLMHLPLYSGIETLEIGLPKNASFTPIPPAPEKPILYYGTSIAQGACASRPGMAYTNILSRRLNRPFLNFGFSGAGRMELEVGQFLAELDPALFVLDCLPNLSADETLHRTEPFVRLLRRHHPDTPILLVEDRTADYAFLRPGIMDDHLQRRANYRRACQNLLHAGIHRLHYLDGGNLLGADGEATVDGSHPNDLGMTRYADALEPALRRLLPA